VRIVETGNPGVWEARSSGHVGLFLFGLPFFLAGLFVITLPLGLVNGIQHNFANAFKIAPSTQPVVRQLVLGTDVLATTAFEHQFDHQGLIFV